VFCYNTPSGFFSFKALDAGSKIILAAARHIILACISVIITRAIEAAPFRYVTAITGGASNQGQQSKQPERESRRTDTMKRDLNYAGEKVRANVAEMAEKARDISNKVKEQWGDSYRDLEQGVNRAKKAGERSLEDARAQIKDKPITAVATVGIAAFAIGLFAGLLLGRKTKD
jgi:ElaB/YqjD/DUF883 family membrane-anchored ribosome-binding protein